jgi:hypothetical protein
VSQSQYSGALKASTRGYATRIFDYFQFWSGMDAAIRLYLTRAWYAGAAECGIAASELSPEEKTALENMIGGERANILSLATFIDGIRTDDGTFPNDVRVSVFARVDLWAQRYKDAQNQARVMACGDRKLMWVLGATEDHCPTCLKLEFKVKRASQWQAAGIRPQNPPNAKLECGGWYCDCSLVQTDEPMSKGPLPGTP